VEHKRLASHSYAESCEKQPGPRLNGKSSSGSGSDHIGSESPENDYIRLTGQLNFRKKDKDLSGEIDVRSLSASREVSRL